jgi:hypothetical protein
MDVVTLPLVRSETEVGVALGLLRRRERAGLVVVGSLSPDHRGLLYAGDLLRAQAEQVERVGSVATRPVLVIDAALSESYRLDLVHPIQTGDLYETMLLQRGFDYALVGEADDTATIVTLHEEQTRTLRGTGGYRCGGQPTHYFPEPRVRLGQICPFSPHNAGPGSPPPIIETA